jgi:hypothetical protein
MLRGKGNGLYTWRKSGAGMLECLCTPPWLGNTLIKMIELDELQHFSKVLASNSCSPEDFELQKLDLIDPKSGELLPTKGYVEVRRQSNNSAMACSTGDGSTWVQAFERLT